MRAHPARRTSSRTRSALITSGLITAALAFALAGTGATYALWNVRAPVNAATVTSGTTGLSVTGPSGLDLTKLSPGQSVAAPITLTNTGSSHLNANVTGTSVVKNDFSDALTMRLTPATTCTVGLVGGVTGAMNGFSTPSAAPYDLPVGASVNLCLEVTLASSAPASAQNLTASPISTFNAVQVRG